jgi:hypothetical protein
MYIPRENPARSLPPVGRIDLSASSVGYSNSVFALKQLHHKRSVILSVVWPFYSQTESKDLRLLFTFYGMNFRLTAEARKNKQNDRKNNADQN